MKLPYKKIGLAAIILLLTATAFADAGSEAEIEYLLSSVGASDCTFIRNNDIHSPADAEAHLRMKYGRGKRWVASADDFIERIASKSSWSGKPYQVGCPNEPPVMTEKWLTEKLRVYRSQ